MNSSDFLLTTLKVVVEVAQIYIVIGPHTLWFKKVALSFAVTLVNVLSFSVVFKNCHAIELRD